MTQPLRPSPVRAVRAVRATAAPAAARRYLVAAAAAALAWGAHAAPAAATCSRLRWLGTAPGTALPPNGVLYATTRSYDPVVAAFAGAAGTARVVDDGGAHGLAVVELSYAAVADQVSVGVTDDASLTFPVDPAWAAPADPPRVVSMGRSQLHGTCTSQDAVAIQVDQPVAAFRVRWYTAAAGWTDRVIVPQTSGVPGETPRLLLGSVDCGPDTVPVEDLAAGVVLDVRAIRFDGSEVAVTGVPSLLALGDLGPFAVVQVVPEAWLRAPTAPEAGPVAPSPTRSGHGAVVLGLLLGAVALGARRGHRLAVARVDDELPRARARR
ncbi:MAG: hypothetical protein H6709_08680 [Kofleriaceae bacterium]|nr:hypothetical protein [Kofleriaceae bacterium]